MTNSGDENNAVFDFVIPRGEQGGGGAGTLDVLATVDSSSQTTTPEGALAFNNTPLLSGTAITHQAGSTDVEINQPGIYQAAFQGTAAVETGTPIPASVLVRLYLNGALVAGGVASHTFASSNEVATMSFQIPFQVESLPARLQVVASSGGFVFTDLALTVIRLGDASNS